MISKKFALILATTVLISALSATTFAAGTSSTSDSTKIIENALKANKINKEDPLYLSLEEKKGTLEGLSATKKALEEQLKAKGTSNGDLKKELVEQVKNIKKDRMEAVKSQLMPLQESILKLKQDKIVAAQTLSSAIASKDKAAIEAANQARKAIETQLKALEAQLKALKEEIKPEDGDTTKADFKAIYEELKAMHDQISYEVRSQLVALHAQKDSEALALRESMKNGDLAGANAHMDKILAIKKQIIDELQKSLTLRTQIETKMNAILAGKTTQTTSSR